MGILEGSELEEFKRKFLLEVEADADRLYEKHRWQEGQAVSEIDLQLAILQELREQKAERIREKAQAEMEQKLAAMDSTDKFLDASEKLYPNTPHKKEADHFISSETHRLCNLLYGSE